MPTLSTFAVGVTVLVAGAAGGFLLPASCSIATNKTTYAIGETITVTYSSNRAVSVEWNALTSGIMVPAGLIAKNGTATFSAVGPAGTKSLGLTVYNVYDRQNSCSVSFTVSSTTAPATVSNCTFNGQTVVSGTSVAAYLASSVPYGQTCTSQSRTCTNGTLSGSYQYASCIVAPASSCTFNGQTVAHGASVTAYLASSVPSGQSCTSQSRTCTNGTLSGTYPYASCSVAQATTPDFISTIMQPGCFTLQTNEFLPEVNGSWDGFPRFAGIHMSPVYFASAQANLNTAKAIIDLWPYLFQNDGTVHPSIATELDTLGKQYLDANLGKIFAFYIMDEPTGHNISKTSMEAAIAAVKTRFPGIPTYSIYAQDCFDNASSLDAKCGMAGKRGVPSNLDWVGFDWYMPSDTSNDTTVFKTQITDTVTRLKSLTTKPIILVPDVTDQMLQSLAVNWRDYWLSERFKRYAALMRLDTQVKGIDAYAWVQHGNACSTTGTTISGARYWPSVRTALYQESIK